MCEEEERKEQDVNDTIAKFPLSLKRWVAINLHKLNSNLIFFRFVLFPPLTVIFVLDSLGFAPNNDET